VNNLPKKINPLRIVLGWIPVRKKSFELDQGAKVRFYLNAYGQIIQLALSRNWRKRDFGIPRGRPFSDLSGGFQNRGGWAMSLSGWRGLLRARRRSRNRKKGYDKYRNEAINCVVIHDSDNQILAFTIPELMEIAALRRKIKRGKFDE
jgi:hypothetical protein